MKNLVLGTWFGLFNAAGFVEKVLKTHAPQPLLDRRLKLFPKDPVGDAGLVLLARVLSCHDLRTFVIEHIEQTFEGDIRGLLGKHVTALGTPDTFNDPLFLERI